MFFPARPSVDFCARVLVLLACVSLILFFGGGLATSFGNSVGGFETSAVGFFSLLFSAFGFLTLGTIK